MHVEHLAIQNIKSLAALELTLPEYRPTGNWCVLLGENGTGKSTVLQTIALALTPSASAVRLLEDPARWVAVGTSEGRGEVTFGWWEDGLGESIRSRFVITRAPGQVENQMVDEPSVIHLLGDLSQRERHLLFGATAPYVIAGYGPFPRLEPGETLTRPTRRADAFRTLFDPLVGLGSLEVWLQRLDHTAKDNDNVSEPYAQQTEQMLTAIVGIINGLLPPDGRFQLERRNVNASGVFFSGPEGAAVPLSAMSDGYRTMFGLAADLIRSAFTQMGSVSFSRHRGHVSADFPGIVLIDEVETHLHPKWQREIGFYLQRAFPRVQFIVATHSPFVAQAATEGGLFVLHRQGAKVEVDQSLESVRGWEAEEIFHSSAFGLQSTRDPETARRLEEYRQLKAKQDRTPLSEEERGRLALLAQELQTILPPENPMVDAKLEELVRRLQEVRRQHD